MNSNLVIFFVISEQNFKYSLAFYPSSMGGRLVMTRLASFDLSRIISFNYCAASTFSSFSKSSPCEND